MSTEKLAGLGWSSTPLEEGIERAVEDHLERTPDIDEHGPDRALEERLLAVAGGDVRLIDGS
ncbi:hypothetical protein [Natrononativus amylolyticus]|uniref:hypothetical protein n=1 Tax=Natrononativus amylolyticus TaxID=2963434 RepID=UPI0020CDBB70|nr:hypothetical protein [Natrononativus amylolyticus]